MSMGFLRTDGAEKNPYQMEKAAIVARKIIGGSLNRHSKKQVAGAKPVS
ncbi:hypothetical protein ACQ9Y2_12240 [Pseudomonas palleroniana]